jgi:hypothetical protein
MNLPSGVAVKTGLDLAAVDFFALVRELQQKAFNGYLVVAVPGKDGLEEGTLLLDSGKVVAALYEYLAFARPFYGQPALERVLNAALAKSGVIDVFQLSSEQVQLVLAFNEQAIVIPSEKELKAWQGRQHALTYEEEVARTAKALSREELMKQYRIGDVKKMEGAPAGPKPPTEAGSMLAGLMKKARAGAEKEKK